MEKKIHTIYTTVIRGQLLSTVRRFVSPLFLMMLFASLLFWYVAKLSYTYTTDLDVKMRIEDQKFETKCVVEGFGTKLLGYHIYRGGSIKLSLSDLKYKRVKGDDGNYYIRIDEGSLSTAVAMHYSDIKLISIGTPPDVLLSEEIEKSLERSK